MKVLLSLSVLSFIVLSGCASTKQIRAKVNVLKKEGGTMLAVSSSTTEAIAYDGAKVKAEEHCFKQGKDYVVVNEESSYQGGDKTAKGIASAVTNLFGKGGGSDNLDDYRVKMVFKCDGNYTGKGEPFARTLDLSGHTYY